MTGLRTWRKIAKTLIVACFAWEVAATLGGIVLLVLIAVQGGGRPTPDQVVSIVAALGLYGFVIWVIRDAQKRTRRQTPKRVAAAEEES